MLLLTPLKFRLSYLELLHLPIPQFPRGISNAILKTMKINLQIKKQIKRHYFSILIDALYKLSNITAVKSFTTEKSRQCDNSFQ